MTNPRLLISAEPRGLTRRFCLLGSVDNRDRLQGVTMWPGGRVGETRPMKTFTSGMTPSWEFSGAPYAFFSLFLASYGVTSSSSAFTRGPRRPRGHGTRG